MRIGVSSAFWHNPTGDDLGPWLNQVAEIGYEGVALFADFWIWKGGLEDPDRVRSELEDRGLALAALLTGVHVDFDRYRTLARNLASLGCRHLVCIGGAGHEEADLRTLGAVLNRIGSTCHEVGVGLSYHNHTGTSGERYGEVESLLRFTDPSLVSIDLDLGHAVKDFVDIPPEERSVRFLQEHWDRLGLVEFKDWSPESGLDTVLGEGCGDVRGAVKVLHQRGYDDWILVEQNHDLGRAWQERLACSAQSLGHLTAILRDELRSGPGDH